MKLEINVDGKENKNLMNNYSGDGCLDEWEAIVDALAVADDIQNFTGTKY